MESLSKNILVTGGTGFIGRHLVKRLLELENIVTIIDLSLPEPELFSKNDRIKIIKGNIAEQNDLEN